MLDERDIAVTSIGSTLAWMKLRKKSGRFFKGYDTMLKKQSQISASNNGRNVHNGPTFLRTVILWTKCCAINIHTYIILKHTLILKNIKHLTILEINPKRAETDRELSLGLKESLDEFPVFTALWLREVTNWYSLGVTRTQQTIPSLSGFGNQKREAGYYSSRKVKGSLQRMKPKLCIYLPIFLFLNK